MTEKVLESEMNQVSKQNDTEKMADEILSIDK